MSRKPSQQSRAKARQARSDAAWWKAKSKTETSAAHKVFDRQQAAKRLLDARREERKW